MQEVQAEIESKSSPLQTEAQELIDYANSAAANAEEIEMVQGRLGEIQTSLREMQQEGTNRLADLEASLQAEVTIMLTSEVEAFAVERNIDVVLNWGQSGEGVLYGSAGWDVTAPLLEFLNSRLQLEVSDDASTSDTL